MNEAVGNIGKNGPDTANAEFNDASRAQVSFLAPLEKKCLVWLAGRAPRWINSDHLAALGLVALAGAGLSYWYARWSRLGLALPIVYFMLSIEVYLATYTLGTFHLSFWKFSPTELRILLIIGNLALLWRPWVHLFGDEYLLFDVGGVVGIAGMSLMLVSAAVRHTIELYRLERLP